MDDNRQLGSICGLLVGDLPKGSIFHPICWLSHKSRRPVKSLLATGARAVSKSIDEANTIASVYPELFNTEIKVRTLVVSEGLFTSLSTQRISMDRPIRGDVGVIIYEFETGIADKILWIAAKINISDVLTKKDSCLTETLQLTLSSGTLPIKFESL